MENLNLIQAYVQKYPGPWIVGQRSTPVDPQANITLGHCSVYANECQMTNDGKYIIFLCNDGKMYLGEMILSLEHLRNGHLAQAPQGKEVLNFQYIWTQNANLKDFLSEITVVIEHT